MGQMTTSVEQPSIRVDIGATVAEYVVPETDVLPPQQEVEQRLETIFATLQQHDQQSNESVASFIRTNTQWYSYARSGGTNNHYVIDTFLEHEDGGVSYIELDYKFPVEPDTDRSPYDRSEETV